MLFLSCSVLALVEISAFITLVRQAAIKADLSILVHVQAILVRKYGGSRFSNRVILEVDHIQLARFIFLDSVEP